MGRAFWLLFIVSIYSYIGSTLCTPTTYCSTPGGYLGRSLHQCSAPLRSSSSGDAVTVSLLNAINKRIILGDGWDILWFDGPAYLPVDTAGIVLADLYVDSEILCSALTCNLGIDNVLGANR